ncbi:MAG: phosphatidylglycerol lysyltransferase domain-containing protein [Treponemataceae bacterium]|nr:MAG: phosphatidylglycerol lysyltransferase domain-containing protein [Treponemataceae bacterium]
MSFVPVYPDFAPITLDMSGELDPFCKNLEEGVCEFVFANLFLVKNKYEYTITRLSDASYALSGVEHTGGASGFQGSFFSILASPASLPPFELIEELLARHDFWKSVTQAQYQAFGGLLEAKGFRAELNRSNFDYLYLRSDLAELRGKKFHKKKNLVNAFNAAYPDARVEAINDANKSEALAVLNTWERLHVENEVTDYESCKSALAYMRELGLDGILARIGGKPAAFSLGEPMAAGGMYCVHFEKAIDAYKGIYQYVNQQEALALPESVTYINREQDVGDEGLRQAKMTYRPVKFVEKYAVFPPASRSLQEL